MTAPDSAGCSSHMCDIEPPIGQGTNGPCNCDDRQVRRALRKRNAENRTLAAELAEARADLLAVVEAAREYMAAQDDYPARIERLDAAVRSLRAALARFDGKGE